MNVQFLQSWKGAFLVAGVITIAVAGYKVVFGPDAATRIAELRVNETHAADQPSAEIMDRPIVASLPLGNIGYSLRELTQLFEEQGTLSFEPIDAASFVLRINGVDALTRAAEEFAFRFSAVDGPQGFPFGVAEFQGKAVVFESMAYNRNELSLAEAVNILLSLQGPIELRR